MKKVRDFLCRYEFLLFIAGVILVLKEVFARHWIVTEDGAAHIYNAVISREIFFHPGVSVNSIFVLNQSLVPNCLGHIILSVLSSFFSLEVSDKILHFIQVTGLCFSFRFLVLQIEKKQPFNSWLIFPFVYSGIFYLGFYNFSLGIILFLLATGVWLWREKAPDKKIRLFLLWGICILLFCTHLIPFVLFVGVAGLRILFHLISKDYKLFFRESGALAIIMAVPGIFFAIYYSHRTETVSGITYADPLKTIESFFSMHFLAVHSPNEAPYAKLISIVLWITLFISIIVFFKGRKLRSAEQNRKIIFWGITWLLLLTLMFVMPDDFAGSGAVTLRLVEISVLLMLVFISSANLKNRLIIPVAFISLGTAILLMNVREDGLWELNESAKKAVTFAPMIKENSTGIYVPLTGNWLKVHLGELAFAESKCALLSNYETTHDFFVLKWKDPLPFNYTLGGLKSAQVPYTLSYWPESPNKPLKNIDYVLICKDHISDTTEYHQLNEILRKDYVLRKNDFPFSLYESHESVERK